MGIRISGKLSAFGALAVALLILAFGFEKAGSISLANSAHTSFGLVIGIITVGAFFSMKSRLFK